MKYRVTIECIEDREFFVEAESEDEAKSKGLAALRNGEAPADFEPIDETVREVIEWRSNPACNCENGSAGCPVHDPAV